MMTTTLMGDQQVELPDWLHAPSPPPPAPAHVTTHTHTHVPTSSDYDPNAVKELTLMQFELMFDRVLDEVASGRSISSVLRDDHRKLNLSRFLRWVKSSPERQAKYEQAQEIAAEIKMDECVEIADGEDNLEEVSRSKLRIDTRMIQVKAHYRRRYGDTKTIEFGGSISILNALQEARSRVIENVTDVTLLDAPDAITSTSSTGD